MRDPKESKHDRFVRLAEARTNKTLNLIRLIGQLRSRSIYDYSQDEVDKIFTALEDALAAAKESFKSEEKPKRFSLLDPQTDDYKDETDI